MIRRVSAGAGLGLALALGACLTSTNPDPSLRTSTAVTGQVTRQDGSPVGGPLVAVRILGEVKNGTATVLGESSVIADANGRFLFLFLISGEQPQNGTALVEVTPPIASALLPVDTAGIPIKVSQGDVPSDTAYVQLVLPPR
ncbi:MAG: hypothetical protein R2882_06215 [Gemmatimonadales bacterium]